MIASTGAMLVIGHEVPARISAIARRTESLIRIPNMGNSRQVSGASDASKLQSKLVTQTYLSPQASTDPLTSRVASAAGRLGSKRHSRSRDSLRTSGLTGT